MFRGELQEENVKYWQNQKAVLQNLIRKFLGLSSPDLLVRDMDHRVKW
jgi:hypothetical protein